MNNNHHTIDAWRENSRRYQFKRNHAMTTIQEYCGSKWSVNNKKEEPPAITSKEAQELLTRLETSLDKCKGLTPLSPYTGSYCLDEVSGSSWTSSESSIAPSTSSMSLCGPD
jgi:hypothetical protein